MSIFHDARYQPVVLIKDIHGEVFEEAQPQFDMVANQPGLVLVCSKCADPWCTIFMYSLEAGASHPVKSEFRPLAAVCPSCGGGSLINNYVHATSRWLSINPQFGPKVYQRELDLIVQEIENEKEKEKESLDVCIPSVNSDAR